MWPVNRYGIVSRASALDAGIPERRITEAVRSGELQVVGRGQYLPGVVLSESAQPTALLYRKRCIAAATGPGRLVLSHDSAAAVHGLELLYPDTVHVHLTNGLSGGGYTRARRIVHPGILSDDEVVEIDGVLVTSLERTVVDVALASSRFAQSLTVLDGGLAHGLTDDSLQGAFSTPSRGVSLARRALRFADGRSESPGESWSRAQMIEDDLRLPDLQVEYQLRSGRTARCDFGVRDVFVAEFDGLVKYRRDMRDGEDPEDVVIREKIREDELRDLGLDVARWIWSDLTAHRVTSIVRAHYSRLGIDL
jgi:hypothetical protein